MSIIPVNTFIICQSSYPYTEPLKHYSIQVLQPVSILFVILGVNMMSYVIVTNGYMV